MKIIVVEYDPNWVTEFQTEANKIKAIFGDAIIDIHHIGSTSVPGLMAKPIIDMMPEVTDLALLDAKSHEMEKLGYEVKGEFGIPGRRYFRKGGDNRTHHVHAFKTGDPGLTRHLAFKNYLIAHPNIAKEYGELKFNIAQQYANDNGKYCDAKDPFIQVHEKKALAWYEKR